MIQIVLLRGLLYSQVLHFITDGAFVMKQKSVWMPSYHLLPLCPSSAFPCIKILRAIFFPLFSFLLPCFILSACGRLRTRDVWWKSLSLTGWKQESNIGVGKTEEPAADCCPLPAFSSFNRIYLFTFHSKCAEEVPWLQKWKKQNVHSKVSPWRQPQEGRERPLHHPVWYGMFQKYTILQSMHLLFGIYLKCLGDVLCWENSRGVKSTVKYCWIFISDVIGWLLGQDGQVCIPGHIGKELI